MTLAKSKKIKNAKTVQRTENISKKHYKMIIDGQLVDTRALDFDPDAKISDRSFTLNDPNAIVPGGILDNVDIIDMQENEGFGPMP